MTRNARGANVRCPMAVVPCVMDLAKQTKRPNERVFDKIPPFVLGQSVSWSLKQVDYTADNSHRAAHICSDRF